MQTRHHHRPKRKTNAMNDREKMSDFFLGLIGVAAVGLLVAALLLPVVLTSGNSDIAYVDARPISVPTNQDNN